jgi:hypothetical protein
MAEHSLFPGYVLFNYHSNIASHTMTLPTRNWNPVSVTGTMGSFEAWDSSTRDAEAMIDDLVTAFAAAYSSEVVFDRATIYQLASETDPPLPKAAKIINVPGTFGTPGWFKAVQATYTLFDSAFETAKLVLLDFPSRNSFGTRPAGPLTEEQAILDEYVADTNAWSSRAGFQPQNLRTMRLNINDVLLAQI